MKWMLFVLSAVVSALVGTCWGLYDAFKISQTKLFAATDLAIERREKLLECTDAVEKAQKDSVAAAIVAEKCLWGKSKLE